MRPDCIPAGRVYFCEHRTPELVWRPEWQDHPNGVVSVASITLVAESARQRADVLAALVGSDLEPLGSDGFAIHGSEFSIEVITPSRYAQQFGPVASPPNNRESFFGALRLRTSDLKAVQQIVDQLGLASPARTSEQPASIALRQPDFDTVLEFVAA